MRKLLNTLYIMNPEAYLALEGETVLIENGSIKLGQFPLHNLENIVSFSYKGASPALMGKCVTAGVGLAFYTPNGKYLCRVGDHEHGNVLLRKRQYSVSEQETGCIDIARNFIIGKVYNARWSVSRTLRDHAIRVDMPRLQKEIDQMDANIQMIKQCQDLESLRGLEGVSASCYFSVFDELILNQKESFKFEGRNRRPPLDNINAMLSFGYSMLVNECANALQGVGLDPYVGFMHTDRPGRKSLGLDLMEELRPLVVDRFVLTLINNRQINASHFIATQSGAVEFTEDGKKLFLSEWQKHKQKELVHPFLKEKINWGLVPHIQALLLARHLRGDLDGYPPFLWR